MPWNALGPKTAPSGLDDVAEDAENTAWPEVHICKPYFPSFQGHLWTPRSTSPPTRLNRPPLGAKEKFKSGNLMEARDYYREAIVYVALPHGEWGMESARSGGGVVREVFCLEVFVGLERKSTI